ncbi:RNA-binding protein [Sinomonas flava]|uniref:RNA-binding protein n=1 Tax=Sinomonas flava TaxID=496857 RepID=A0ABP5NKG7_9MICC
MGVIHPENLDDWKAWQERRKGLRRWQTLFNASRKRPEHLSLSVRGAHPKVLLALDSRSVTTVRSLYGILAADLDLAVLSSVHDTKGLTQIVGAPSERVSDAAAIPDSVKTVVSAGHFLPAGAAAEAWARTRNTSHVVVQHGLMTPFAPPLPPNGHLLAISESDAEFWKSGRTDITYEVVGSQLFWDAANAKGNSADLDGQPVFLGQLHGAELSRWGMSRAAGQFWRQTGCLYRPHPSETDRLSRLQHSLWSKRGMAIDLSGKPLSEISAPVVAAFSTGVLEAAARGIPAWVYYPSPPAWLSEFWTRYRMSRWAVDVGPTPAPPLPASRPVESILAAVLRLSGETS